MKGRSRAFRRLAGVLLVLWWAQTAAVVLHPPVERSSARAGAREQNGHRHDPRDCSLCGVLAQLRAQDGAVIAPAAPPTRETVSVRADVAVAAPPQPAPFRQRPRAPPISPLA